MLIRKDYAKYPFTVEAANYVKGLGFKLEEFSDSSDIFIRRVIERAAERIKRAVSDSVKSIQPSTEENRVEVLSFPIAMVMMKKIGDPYFQRRFALHEAKKASAWLKDEDLETVVDIARNNFKWKIQLDSGNKIQLHVTDYLKNTSRFHEDKWKLVNMQLEDGKVYVSKVNATRLLQEEIKEHIELKLQASSEVKLPPSISEKMKDIEVFLQEQKRNMVGDESLGKVDSRIFPPCIKHLHSCLLGGKNISHVGRFTLTSFLINIGMSTEDISKIYVSATDFDEQLTRYQVEHIAGITGGKVRYRPLGCDNMRTHRLCIAPDTVCQRIKHPLQYYRIKKRNLKTEEVKSQWKPSTLSEGNSKNTT
jgi:DNA primase large subunit